MLGISAAWPRIPIGKLIMAAMVGVPEVAWAQSRLPPCLSDQTAYYSDCFGTYTLPSGERYVGEFKDGMPNGQGTLASPSGRRYASELKDGKANGQGIATFPSGDRYEGAFKDDKFNGQGTYTFRSGEIYEGEFKDDKFNGQGTKFFFRDGSVLAGLWRENQFVAPPSMSAPTQPPARLVPQVAGGSSIPLTRDGGVYRVPVLVNGVIPLHFMVDSGAADVSIPADVVMTLIRTGTLSDQDFVGEQIYRLADGSTVKSKTFRIRRLKVGDKVVDNVMASVANVNGSLLLGQSFLSRFKSVKFDYAQGMLVLE